MMFDPQRFLDAQEGVFDQVIEELSLGQKSSHWMWFIFPQADGLGRSDTSRFFALKSMEHALLYSEHPVIGPRLATCTKMVIENNHRSAEKIFGKTDALKFWSSMTLFSLVSPSISLFHDALKIFFLMECQMKQRCKSLVTGVKLLTEIKNETPKHLLKDVSGF